LQIYSRADLPSNIQSGEVHLALNASFLAISHLDDVTAASKMILVNVLNGKEMSCERSHLTMKSILSVSDRFLVSTAQVKGETGRFLAIMDSGEGEKCFAKARLISFSRLSTLKRAGRNALLLKKGDFDAKVSLLKFQSLSLQK